MISPFGVDHGMKCDIHGEISKACWDNYRQKGMKVKGGRMVPNCVPKKTISKAKRKSQWKAYKCSCGNELMTKQKSPKGIVCENSMCGQTDHWRPIKNKPAGMDAEIRVPKKKVSKSWQTKEGKNPKGGLNEKGRKSYERENPGSNLKPPVKSGNNPRRASFLARMGNMPGPERKPNGEPTRLLLSLQAWGASSKADAKKKAAALSARNKISKSSQTAAVKWARRAKELEYFKAPPRVVERMRTGDIQGGISPKAWLQGARNARYNEPSPQAILKPDGRELPGYAFKNGEKFRVSHADKHSIFLWPKDGGPPHGFPRSIVKFPRKPKGPGTGNAKKPPKS